MTNNVKQVWASGKAVVNAWLAIPSGFSAEVIAQLLPEFERRNPAVRVKVQQLPWTAAHVGAVSTGVWLDVLLPARLQRGR